MKSLLENLFGIDLRSLALFRILLGILLLIYLTGLAFDLREFYTDDGILPRSLVLQFYPFHWRVSAHLMSGSLFFQAFLFLSHAVLAILLILGWRTRWVTFLSWFLLMSLHVRNPMVLHSGDYLFRLLIFWGIFLPLGASFSLDRIFNSSQNPLPSRILSLGSLAFLLQVVFVYIFTGIAKANDPGWQAGRGVLQSLQTIRYTTPLGALLLQWTFVHKVLSYAVLGFEIVGPMLLFSPFWTAPSRLFALFGFFLLQLGLGLCLNLGNFPWVSTVALIPFLPSAVWEKIHGLKWLPTGWRTDGAAQLLRSRLSFLGFRLFSVKTPDSLNILAVFSLLCVLIINLSNISKSFHLPDSMVKLETLLFLDQRWNMFAPLDEASIWMVVKGEERDGTTLDLLRNNKGINWERPPYGQYLYKNSHWSKYMNHLWAENFAAAKPYYAWNLCRKWNEKHRAEDQLKKVEIYALNERFYPRPQPVKKFHLWTHYCFEEDIPEKIPPPSV